MSSKPIETSSIWVSLHQSLFRALWIAALASSIGTWMQNVGASWLMTTLTPSAVLVALMQSATSLPILLVGLFAGALADVVDRRRLLIVTQCWMLAAATVLYGLTLLGATTPWVLLALTFALGLGAAMIAPAWQAITPDLVSRDELPSAVALNGVSINLARAIGPAIGGFMVAAAGPAPVFLLNAMSFLGVILVLFRWHPASTKSVLPAERVMGAIRAGLRFARYTPAIDTLLIRTITFILFGSALWALMPQVVNHVLQAGAIGYGLLLGCVGLGAVIGATVLLPLRQKLSIDHMVASASLAFAFATLSLAFLHTLILLCLTMFIGGVAWIAVMSSLNIAAQMVAPIWVRARALGIYLMVFQGGQAVGSILWGIIAVRTSITIALSLAALGLALGGALAARWHLAAGEQANLTLSMNWPEPYLVIEPRLEAGPVLIMSEYAALPDLEADYVQAM